MVRLVIGINDHDTRFKFTYEVVHGGKVHLQTIKGGAYPMKLQQALFNPGLKVNAYGAHIAYDLVLGFLEGKVEAAFTAAAGFIDKAGADAGFPRSRCAGYENAAAAVKPLAPQHGVQPLECRLRYASRLPV